MPKNKSKESSIKVRGFFRGQLVNPDGSIAGDTGWIKNKATNAGLINLANLVGKVAGSYAVGYAALGTQTAAVNMSQTDISGQTNSFIAVTPSVSGTATLQLTAQFASSDLAASCAVGVAGLYKTNSAGSLIACQIFTTSAWAVNQDFNLTYNLIFSTA
jgi:hypothetical protein